MASLYAQKSLSTAQADLAGSVQKLSSGKRINSAKDDAAGYAVSEAVKATKNITDQSIQNTQDAISMVQTAEGALDVVSKMLQRVLTLATQKENGTLTTGQTTSINNEITSLLTEVGQIKSRTRFQGGQAGIFNRTSAGTGDTAALVFTTGSGTTNPTSTTIEIADLTLGTTTSGLSNGATATISSSSSSADIMIAVQNNINNRAKLGAYQQQLNYIVDNMQTLSNNLADAQSRIVDTNYAAETANLTRGQILQQAATSMLAQANQMPNVILTLLK
jgi:flagellin